MQACVFCPPRPDLVFHRGTLVWGLWDAIPVAPGHALLVTVRHVETWFDASDAERMELALATSVARQAILERFGAAGFTLGVNVGAAAGQTVAHLHLHVIPRRWGDVANPRGGVRHVVGVPEP
jgi:diadenosine tetraphosphate (Ap4A) HIT family hydrolase